MHKKLRDTFPEISEASLERPLPMSDQPLKWTMFATTTHRQNTSKVLFLMDVISRCAGFHLKLTLNSDASIMRQRGQEVSDSKHRSGFSLISCVRGSFDRTRGSSHVEVF